MADERELKKKLKEAKREIKRLTDQRIRDACVIESYEGVIKQMKKVLGYAA